MTDHLVDTAAVDRIARRAEAYLHLARRVVVEIFGPEAGHDHIQTVAIVASVMATLENAEITAAAHDRLVELLARD